MSEYRRYHIEGGAYFFSVVTHERRPILTEPTARFCLHEAIREVKRERPFDLVAIVLMADHLHTIWTLPPGDAEYPLRWAQIKESFTRRYRSAGGTEGRLSSSRIAHRERGAWQRRYWEHTIEEDDDFKHCLDYIHWNPVKHGVVGRVEDYPWSSFQRHVRLGEYEFGWGRVDPCPDADEGFEAWSTEEEKPRRLDRDRPRQGRK